MVSFGALARKVFGSANDRRVKATKPRLQAINALENEMRALSDADLQARTVKFRQELADGKTLDDLLVPAFATVREAARRVLGNGVVLVPRASLAWQYAFGDLTPEASLSFADASDLAFTVAGAPIAQNAALIDAGIDLEINRALRIGLSYYGQLSSEAQDSAVRGNLTWKF